MKEKTFLSITSKEKAHVLRVGLTTGLAILILGALLWGLQGVTPSHADSDGLYVDGASGQDTGTCGTTGQPCKTISHTINTRAGSSETIRVAQGVYTENLLIDKPVRLEGGYEATNWTRDVEQYQTVIDGSNSRPVWGAWDETRVRYPTVVTDDGGYQMWYVGYDRNEVGRIGYATSPDGLNWTKHPGNPVLGVGSGSVWDSEGFESPFVVKEDGIYKMWYGGRGASDDYWRTGYATSTDGVSWTKYPKNPVIDVGDKGWNNRIAQGPYVLREGGSYKMWLYTAGDDGSGWTPYIAYATSTDGLDWEWDSANPLFSRDPAHDWESEWVWNPSILHVGSEYQMWYSAWGNDQGYTGYATATNETDWTKYNGGVQPVLSGTPGAWDEGVAYDPFVLYGSGVYTMWYDEGASIGVATSTNGIDWTKHADWVLSSGRDTEWSWPVMVFIPDGDGSVLDGFTVRNGYAKSGGGIYARAHVTIQNCTVTGNTAHESGGGIAVEWGSADVTISNTEVVSNYAGSYGGGIEVDNDAVATIINSDIVSNTATEEGGGGLSIHARAFVTDSRILSNTLTKGWASAGILVSNDALATLHANEIAWNEGFGNSGPSGGIRVHSNSVLTVVNNHIHHNVVNDGDGGAISADGSTLRAYANRMVHNQARSGGALRFANHVNAILDGNVIAENEVNGSGGGAHIYNSVVTFTNNVIAFNSGDEDWNGDGLAIRDTDSDVRVVNNTIVSNTAEGIDASDGAEVLLRNNVVAGNRGGIHNYQDGAQISADHNALWNNGWNSYDSGPDDIEVDPLFVDAANGDFHLRADSPCIDAGTATGAPDLDFEGTPRDASPDIGAYEWGKYRIFLPAAVRETNPVTEWTERITVTYEYTPPDQLEYSVHTFCVKDTDGDEHVVQLGSCDTTSATGDDVFSAVRPLGGSIPLLIDDTCETYMSGPAYDPVTRDLGPDAAVTLSTESSDSAGDLIVAEFVGIPCAGGS
jgi:parallel beta-helix repeat protein